MSAVIDERDKCPKENRCRPDDLGFVRSAFERTGREKVSSRERICPAERTPHWAIHFVRALTIWRRVHSGTSVCVKDSTNIVDDAEENHATDLRQGTSPKTALAVALAGTVADPLEVHFP
jgi:hypothetical protein